MRELRRFPPSSRKTLRLEGRGVLRDPRYNTRNSWLGRRKVSTIFQRARSNESSNIVDSHYISLRGEKSMPNYQTMMEIPRGKHQEIAYISQNIKIKSDQIIVYTVSRSIGGPGGAEDKSTKG